MSRAIWKFFQSFRRKLLAVVDKEISFDEAIAMIVRQEGVSPEKAKLMLLHELSKGRITATGRNSRTGDREAVPPSYFPKSEHERS